MKITARKPSAAKLLILLLTALACLPSSVRADKTLPEFQLQSVSSSERIDSQNHLGKVMLINFWATWCPPCRKEIPSLIKLQQEFNSKGFTVIGISVDQAGPDGVKQFADKMGINYPIGMGTAEIAKKFGSLAGIPSSFLIDRKGVIARSYAGYVPHEQLKKDIEELIGL